MTDRLGLLFVCTGNTCRSPLAAAIATSLGVEASSAGIEAVDGSPASPFAIIAGRAAGLDVSQHRSRILGAADVADAGAVLAMTDAQVEEIRRRWPQHAAKVERLDPEGDIPDPFGGSPSEYAAAVRTMRAAVERRRRAD